MDTRHKLQTEVAFSFTKIHTWNIKKQKHRICFDKAEAYYNPWCLEVISFMTYDLVPKGVHARGYALQFKTLSKTVFIWNVVLCTCMNQWIYSTDNFSNQAVVDFKIQSSHTEKAPKNDCQKRTSMYRVIFVTLLTNKSQAHGETITDLDAENIVWYG